MLMQICQDHDQQHHVADGGDDHLHKQLNVGKMVMLVNADVMLMLMRGGGDQ